MPALNPRAKRAFIQLNGRTLEHEQRVPDQGADRIVAIELTVPAATHQLRQDPPLAQ